MSPSRKSKARAKSTKAQSDEVDKDEYIAKLEQELEETKAQVVAMKAKGGEADKGELRADILFTDKVWNFCQQFLFTRIKFLPKGWKVYDQKSTTNFAAIVKRHVKVGEGVTFGGEWERIIVDAIIRKYTDMRCNVNNNIRKMFKGKYSIIIIINNNCRHLTHRCVPSPC